jgi:hypothetical protein
MASRFPHGPFIIYVKFEMREDGGLRASCDKVPGFLLSHSNHGAVRSDVVPALEVILSEMYGVPMKVEPASEVGSEDQYEMPAHLCGKQGYVGHSLNN